MKKYIKKTKKATIQLFQSYTSKWLIVDDGQENRVHIKIDDTTEQEIINIFNITTTDIRIEKL